MPASHPWLYRQYPAADGDVPMICELFALSVQAATRYTSTGGFAAG
ncbi:hypothetical protein ABZ791_28800 [Streptomyces huasconensis]|uniref:GNAT family N-acetyltransferase n=1 Tax=Streptomyces huasconensis TaxID=1854574 RepID=A0ABV3M7N4_9ACTN